jgi:hypothetical protein
MKQQGLGKQSAIDFFSWAQFKRENEEELF